MTDCHGGGAARTCVRDMRDRGRRAAAAGSTAPAASRRSTRGPLARCHMAATLTLLLIRRRTSLKCRLISAAHSSPSGRRRTVSRSTRSAGCIAEVGVVGVAGSAAPRAPNASAAPGAGAGAVTASQAARASSLPAPHSTSRPVTFVALSRSRSRTCPAVRVGFFSRSRGSCRLQAAGNHSQASLFSELRWAEHALAFASSRLPDMSSIIELRSSRYPHRGDLHSRHVRGRNRSARQRSPSGCPSTQTRSVRHHQTAHTRHESVEKPPQQVSQYRRVVNVRSRRRIRSPKARTRHRVPAPGLHRCRACC